MHFTRESDQPSVGCSDRRGMARMFLNLQPVFLGPVLESNMSSSLLGPFWPVCRRHCHHIGIAWTFQRQRMTHTPGGSYLIFLCIKMFFRLLDEKA